MNLRHPLAAALVLALAACTATVAEKPASVSTAEASRLIATEPAPVVLDVRTRGEFAEGHIAGAKLIPWTDGDFEKRALAELDRTRPVLVYCRSGKRSAAASEKLASLGFTGVRHLKGGTLAWRKDGLPLTPTR